MITLALWFSGSAALAQTVAGGAVPDLNAQRFRPAIDAGRTLWVDDARMPAEGAQGRFLLSYHRDPLVYRSGDDETSIVRDVFQGNVLGGWGIGPVRVGIDVPVYLYTDGPVTDGESGIGDLGLDGRVTIFGEEAPVEAPVDLGVQARLFLPTATVSTALGAPDLAGQVALVGSIDVDRLRLAANVGTRINPEEELENVVLDDAFEYRFGGSFDVADNGGLALEFAGLVYYSAEVANRAGSPFEGLLSGWARPTDTLTVRGGIGRGFTAGVGSPDLRIIAGISLSPASPEAPPVTDTDGDGIADDADKCPEEAEDLDEFEDDDGCPDPTTEVTVRVLSPKGKVVKRASVAYRTPSMEDPETRRGGEQKLDLRPEAWTFEARAPGYEPGTATLDVENGPPREIAIALEPSSERIVVDEEQIELRETIQFQTGSARLLRESLPLLDEIVGLLKEVPEIAKVSIEGHTDNRGDAEANQRLSAERAATVEAYLVNSGIDAERLSSQGFGESKPLDERDVSEAWEKNRRVEVRILEWSDGE